MNVSIGLSGSRIGMSLRQDPKRNRYEKWFTQ
jgi:hypothetical protein